MKFKILKFLADGKTERLEMLAFCMSHILNFSFGTARRKRDK